MSGDLNQPSGTDVVAVVVTWNRRDLLRESLRAIAAQTHPPRRTTPRSSNAFSTG